MQPDRFTGIDDLNRDDHYYLEEGDSCHFFKELISPGGYQASPTNQLIHNYKYPPTRVAAQPNLRRYKERAIIEIAVGLHRLVPPASAEAYTWVPIPPSQALGDPDYDDRLVRTLKRAFGGYNVDMRPLVRQTASTRPDHCSRGRQAFDELYAILEVDRALLASAPLRRKGIILFDDVLTSGKHFKCCKRRLQEVVPPEVAIVGVFVARRVFPDPAEDFEVLE